MRALRLNAWKCEAVLEDVPRPKPEEAAAVYAGLAAGDIAGRAVITPLTEYDPDA